MTEPTTKTGKRYASEVLLGPGSGDESSPVVVARLKAVVAIEQEAAQQERERLREVLLGGRENVPQMLEDYAATIEWTCSGYDPGKPVRVRAQHLRDLLADPSGTPPGTRPEDGTAR